MYWKFRRKNESESENADFSTTLPRTLAVPEEKKPLHVVYSLLQVVCVCGGGMFLLYSLNPTPLSTMLTFIMIRTVCFDGHTCTRKTYRFGPVAGVDRTRVLLWNTLNRY